MLPVKPSPPPVVKLPPPVVQVPDPVSICPPVKKMSGSGDEDKSESRTAAIASQSVRCSIFPFVVSPDTERIRFMLKEEDEVPATPQLFTELDELLAEDGQAMEWKETAR